MFDILNCTLAVSYNRRNLRFENGQVEVRGRGGNCTRFYTSRIQVRSVFKCSLNTERRETSGHLAAATYLPSVVFV